MAAAVPRHGSHTMHRGAVRRRISDGKFFAVDVPEEAAAVAGGVDTVRGAVVGGAGLCL